MTSFRSAILATCLSVAAASSALADPPPQVVERVWFNDPIQVRQVLDDQVHYCQIIFANGPNELGLTRHPNGSVSISFTNHQSPVSQNADVGIVTDVNSNGYHMPMETARTLWLVSKTFAFEGSTRDFLHELWNGSQVTVYTTTEKWVFSLNGSIKALNAWYSCADAIGVAAVPAPAPQVTAPAPAPTPDPLSRIFGGDGSPAAQEIELTPLNGGTMQLTAAINGKEFYFMLDSGASDISVPEAVAKLLVADGLLSRSDFIRMQTYNTANGSIVSPVFKLRTVTLGNTTVHDVEMSVDSTNHAALLGQAFLRRFKNWTIDNARNVLVLGAPI